MTINFKEEVLKHKEDLLKDLFELVSINSIASDDISETAPFGKGIRESLDKFLSFGERDGYTTKVVGNVAGHIEVGKGEDLFGVLGHVDVVPVKESEWISHPFKPEIRDGKIFARGVLDDKGPTLAGYYALKLLDKLGVDWKKRVRIIIGTDEETGFRCVNRYFETEERPSLGFTPDASFPLIYGEKARGTFKYHLEFKDEDNQSTIKLLSLNAGTALNVVPSEVTAVLEVSSTENLEVAFPEFLNDRGLQGSLDKVDNRVTLKLYGKAAHGSTPHLGLNAATQLAEFLNTLALDVNGKNYVAFITNYLANDTYGDRLGLKYEDDEMGTANYNYGIFKYSFDEKIAFVDTDSRYPAKFKQKEVVEKLAIENITIEHYGDKEAHYVPKDDELVQTLLSVYRKHTGDNESEPMVVGGGTYARCLKKGVAFGVLLPGREDTMHQANEYIYVDDLLLSTAIFAEAIYELCCK